ncbi:hypothetical protein BJY04DRAFT_217021 [Aspergillus karnatakaensis]|uniref:uncharacterized protein n=1 Tax=Aspergillus karnatakaensis TaxID=1810916 RepID=UPI003CCE3D87
MPITELIFPVWKTDPQSVASLKEKETEVFKHFSGIKGLEATFRGPVSEANGASVKPESLKTLIVLEWTDVAPFHDFYPNSSGFQSLVQSIKPFVNAPAIPELYEAQPRSIASTSAAVTQVIKTMSGSEAKQAWEQLEEAIDDLATDKPAFYHALGIEKDQGKFLGLIGWKSLEEYERIGKQRHILEHIKRLSKQGEVESLIVQLERLDAV